MKRVIAFSFLCLMIFWLLCSRRVQGNDMAQTLYDGDIITILPLAPKEGDLVVLHDPYAPQSNAIVRRLIAQSGTIFYDRNGTVHRKGKRLSQQDMGQLDKKRVIEERMDVGDETKKWLILRIDEPMQLDFPKQTIDVDRVYLLADNRDEGVDSRFWGAVPKEKIIGVVVMRMGSADTWKGWISWLR